jgi:hypothetical protein
MYTYLSAFSASQDASSLRNRAGQKSPAARASAVARSLRWHVLEDSRIYKSGIRVRLDAKNWHSRLIARAVVTQTKGTFESMEPALADTAPSLSVALKMRSCIVCTDRRPVPICVFVAHRGGRSHDYVRSSKLLPRSPGHVTSSQLTAYACHIHIIMVSCKHGTFWRGSRAWIAGPRRFSMAPRTYLTSGGFQDGLRRYWLRANIQHDILRTFYGMCSLQARKSAGRGRPGVDSAHLHACQPSNETEFGDSICAHSTRISRHSVYQRVVTWKGLVCVVRHAPVRRLDLRGRMRRLGALCISAKSYTLSQYIKARESCNIGLVYHLRRHSPSLTAFAHNQANRLRVP